MSKEEFTPGGMVRAMKEIKKTQTHAGPGDGLKRAMDEASADFGGAADPDATPVILPPDDTEPLGSRDVSALHSQSN